MARKAKQAPHNPDAEALCKQVRSAAPATRRQLKDYVRAFLDLKVPDTRLCDGHAAPMDYLWHAWSVDTAAGRTHKNGDCIVWANRGGGKTRLAAVATLLDCLFKSPCSVRILGGSLEQSTRMYEYLADFAHNGFEDQLDGPIRKHRCRFKNGSTVEAT